MSQDASDAGEKKIEFAPSVCYYCPNCGMEDIELGYCWYCKWSSNVKDD